MIKKLILSLLLTFFSNSLHSQVFNIFEAMRGRGGSSDWRIGGGFSTTFQSKNKNPFYGLHADFDCDNVLLIRFRYLFKQSNLMHTGVFDGIANDTLQNPQNIGVPYDYRESMNYITLQAGVKWHFFNENPDDPEGPSMYAGFLFGLGINTIHYGHNLNDDETQLYTLQDSISKSYNNRKVSGALSFGLLVGGQYTLPSGNAFYLDFNPDFYAFLGPDFFIMGKRRFNFNFNIGFRYWI